MNLQYKELLGKLKINQIRPTFQRIKILEYLLNNPGHPTVDQVFRELSSEVPTLSKTTVYNTLNLFLKAGLVRLLSIEESENRYDIITENHGHFKCDRCGIISNFNINIDRLEPDELTGYQISDKSVYFKGICRNCLANINNIYRKENL